MNIVEKWLLEFYQGQDVNLVLLPSEDMWAGWYFWEKDRHQKRSLKTLIEMGFTPAEVREMVSLMVKIHHALQLMK
jgi:hypothetical protein